MPLEGRPVAERRQSVGEAQVAAVKCRDQGLQEQPPEQARENPDGEEEARPAGDPAGPVRRETAAGDDAMDMRVMRHSLAPGVEHGDDADLGPQEPGFCSGRLQGLGRDAHQEAIDDGLVVEGDLGDGRRHGEDDVEVGDRQQIGDTRRDPFGPRRALALGAMAVATRVVGDAGGAAVVAGLAMTAEGGGPAGFDRTHNAPFAAAEMTGVGATIAIAVAAEDVGDLDRGSHRDHDPGGVTSRRSRSSGLGVDRIVSVETCV